MARIREALRNTPFSGSHPLPSDFHSDVDWFMMYASDHNGLTLLQPTALTPWIIECDSSRVGAGAYSQSHYYSHKYTPEECSTIGEIAQLEAVNLISAIINLSPPDANNYHVIINTDNIASQIVLSSGTGKDRVLTA